MFAAPRPTVVVADDRPDLKEYSYPTPSESQGWFAGLRAKLSQLAAISEWMNQLGISKEESNTTHAVDDGPSTSFSDDTLKFETIKLDHHDVTCSAETADEDWDWSTCFLADLNSSHIACDTLERQHFGPLQGLLTIGRRGEGHEFKTVDLTQPTWCDKCGDFIWGVLRQASKCKRCNLTCHERCRQLVNLDCRSTGSSLASDDFPSLRLFSGTLGTLSREKQLSPKSSDSDKENSFENPLFGKDLTDVPLRVEEIYVKEDTPFEWAPSEASSSLRTQIELFNSSARGMEISMEEGSDGFSGLLQIHMNFTRPISVVAGEIPPAVYDVDTGKSTAKHRTITSFFLPRNTLKHVRVGSATSTRQMIVALLKKFRVADNPKKFALYECSQEADIQTHTLLRKMVRLADDAVPLRIVLGWGQHAAQKVLVLQENDTGDILWDAFEVPELENFLRILGLEEQQYNYQIKQRYTQYRYELDAELRRRQGERQNSAPPTVSTNTSRLYSDPFGSDDQYQTVDDEPLYVNVDELRLQESTRL